MTNWIINENYLLICKINNKLNKDKIFIFDLDNTIITTNSGKTFPVNQYDWKFNFDSVQDKINDLSQDYNVGIVTNQMGLKNNDLIKKWIFKMNNILKKININFVFVSLKNDRYRKPLIGCFEILQNYGLVLENYKSKYYIGDACGRETDHADTDLKFALNSKLKFKPPELFFNIKNLVNNKIKITYPELSYYTVNK